MIAYKLVEQDMKTGKLYPLFIDKKTEIKKGTWLRAEAHHTNRFAPRVGFHSVSVPDAPWLKSEDGTYKASRKGFKRVWCVVVIPPDEMLEGECYNPPLSWGPPEECFYRIKATETRHECYVSGSMFVAYVLDDQDVNVHLSLEGIDTEKTFEPYRKGFEKRRQGCSK